MKRMVEGVKSYAKGYLLEQAAQQAAEMAGHFYNPTMDPIISRIAEKLTNRQCMTLFSDEIRILLGNFNFQKWSREKADLVADRIADTLKKNLQLIEETPEYRVRVVRELSEVVKKTIADNQQDKALQTAITAHNEVQVRECIAAGADAEKFIHMTIADPKKTHLLELLLRAGVNPGMTLKGIDPAINGFNLIAYAALCNNVEAVKILVCANEHAYIAAYYPEQVEDALQASVNNTSRACHGGSALTVAIMNAKKDNKNEAPKNIAMLLLRAGAKLHIVKAGSPHEYPCYNNLQLLIRFKLISVLHEAIKYKDTSLNAQCDLLEALNYKSASTNKSHNKAEDLAKKYCPSMQAIMKETREALTQHIETYKSPSEIPTVTLPELEFVSPSPVAITVPDRSGAPISRVPDARANAFDPCCGLLSVLRGILFSPPRESDTHEVTEDRPSHLKMD